jgi:hypothetical protein
MDRAMEGGVARVRRLRLAGMALIALLVSLNVAVNVGLTYGFDVGLFRAVNSWSTSYLVDDVMIVFTLYGREVIWGGVMIALFFLGGRRGKEAAITMGFVFLILISVVSGWKALEMRPVPTTSSTGFAY